MVKGILADINTRGPVDYLVQKMQAEPWAYYWRELGLVLCQFDDLGLHVESKDLEIWQRCQAEKLVFITNNRNDASADSLENVIRLHNTPESLPVFTIADLDKLRTSGAYAERVLERLYDYLIRIDTVRGTGRMFIP